MAKKILIVEDDKFLRRLISQKLIEEGFEISETDNGNEATEKIQKEMPDLILLDLVLPGTDGFEVLKKTKENEKTKKIPIIILSNLGQKDAVEKGLAMGAVDYLIKAHFTPSEVIEKVKKNINL